MGANPNADPQSSDRACYRHVPVVTPPPPDRQRLGFGSIVGCWAEPLSILRASLLSWLSGAGSDARDPRRSADEVLMSAFFFFTQTQSFHSELAS